MNTESAGLFADRFESEARLVVLPADDQRVSGTQPDRYLLTEMGVTPSI